MATFQNKQKKLLTTTSDSHQENIAVVVVGSGFCENQKIELRFSSFEFDHHDDVIKKENHH